MKEPQCVSEFPGAFEPKALTDCFSLTILQRERSYRLTTRFYSFKADFAA